MITPFENDNFRYRFKTSPQNSKIVGNNFNKNTY